MEATIVYEGIYLGYLRIMEKKMETTIVYEGIYLGYLGIMEKKMETTSVPKALELLVSLRESDANSQPCLVFCLYTPTFMWAKLDAIFEQRQLTGVIS